MAKLFVPLRAAMLLAAAGLTGCATPGPILGQNVTTLRAGIGAARDQSDLAFEAANRAVRQQSIEFMVDQPGITLAEKNFLVAVAPEDAARWRVAFQSLDRYTASLQRLVDPRLAQTTGDTLTDIGAHLQSPNIGANLPAGLTGLFATLGQAIVAAQAERKATDVMRKVDPQFNAVTAAMAGAIGADDTQGIRGTVHGNWDTVLAGINADYAKLAPADRGGRLAVAGHFRDALQSRDAQIANLAGLHDSLLALGSAHTAAARGDSGDALFWIGRIDGWLDDVRRRAARIDAARGG